MENGENGENGEKQNLQRTVFNFDANLQEITNTSKLPDFSSYQKGVAFKFSDFANKDNFLQKLERHNQKQGGNNKSFKHYNQSNL